MLSLPASQHICTYLPCCSPHPLREEAGAGVAPGQDWSGGCFPFCPYNIPCWLWLEAASLEAPRTIPGLTGPASGWLTRCLAPFPWQGLLHRCHSAGATYLFQPDKFYNVAWDTGDKTVQCGRKVDCLKLWLLWKAVGTEGLEKRVDRAFACTR